MLCDRRKRGFLVAGACWLLVMALVVWLLIHVRHRVIASLVTPAAQADWQDWRQAETAREANPQAPVRRRAPKSAEPPALVLLRDSFPAVVGAMLVVTTLCFAFGWISLRGLGRRP